MTEIRLNSLHAWILASRPKTLSGAAIPVIIGSALAYSDQKFTWLPAIICLLFAFLMQIAANFMNDLSDFSKGSDTEERIGPKRACAQGWISPKAMKTGIIITIIISCLTGCSLLFYGGPELILIGIVCVIFALLYTTLSYHGWGDILVLTFFGFVPVGGTYYVLSNGYSVDVAVASLICGLLIDTLLVLNNYRDRFTDYKDGKRTIIVRFGENFGKYFYLFLGLFATLLCLWFINERYWFASFLPFIYIIPHFLTWKKMVTINKGKELNIILGKTSRNIIIMGLLFSAGIILG
ncbi:MAG: 1,4-dihydroxy-2-naphthoate octaprenyltransferase [Prolixibacteraceae bacterium]|nr:1,4-dihydroxy-2-naphthoate octaprenyltransferase [Prolixibacteraceae bacterium]